MPSASGDSVPAILFCCAEEDEMALVGIVAELRGRRYNPEILTGVDLDTTVLGKAVDATRGPGLFVLCESPDLDAFQVRRLEGVFSARSGPMHRSACVRMADGPGIVGQVEAAMQSLGGPATTTKPGGNGSGLRDVVSTTGLSAVPGAVPPPPSAVPSPWPREVPSPRPSAVPPPPAGADPTGADPGPTPGAPAMPESMAREFLRAMAETEAKLANLDVPPVDEPGSQPTLDIRNQPTVKDLRTSLEIAVEETDTTKATEDAFRDVETRRFGPKEQLGAAAAAAAPTPGDALDIDLEPEDEPVAASTTRAEPSRPSALPVFLAITVVVGAGFLGWRALEGPSKGEMTSTDESVSSSPVPAPKTAVAPRSGDRSGEDAPPPSAVAAQGEAAAAVARPEVRVAEPAPTEPEKPGSKSDSPAALDALRVEAALDRGEIRALDGLLVRVPSRAPEMNWNDAARYCRKHRFGGVAKWKLPRLADLRILRKARMLPRGVWWSRTLPNADAADAAYVAVEGNARPVVWLKQEPNARPVCVRKR